jgi:large subunit ribosomal protein L15
MATSSSIRRVVTSRISQFQSLGDTATRAHATARPVACSSQCRHPSSRHFSTGPYVSEETDVESTERPRWQRTPRGMQMPFRIRQVDKKNVWRCNDDPRKVADFYNRFLGQGGESMLNEETRWLAITHKSYDQGRRGFNDRLSYMGI